MSQELPNVGEGCKAFGFECEHHYGITTHPMPATHSLSEAVYCLIREEWHKDGLTDDNHTWRNEPGEYGWSRVVIFKNEKSPRWVLNPYGVRDGAGAVWFDQKYRIACQSSIESEIFDRLRWLEHFRSSALREKPTKAGSKRAQKALSVADDLHRQARLVAKRWPQFKPLTA